MRTQLKLMSYNKEIVRFTRSPKGGYYDADGNRVSIETLMRHSHEINGDEGYYIKDSKK